MTPSVTTRIASGAETTPVASVSFGTVPPSSRSQVVVVDAKFDGFQSVGELGVGVASCSFDGGPSGILMFDVFDSLADVEEPTRTFAGVAGDDGAANVEEVGMRSATESKYVALMAVAQDKPIDCACFVLKWFFGYSKEA
jgi:hypothetical protein